MSTYWDWADVARREKQETPVSDQLEALRASGAWDRYAGLADAARLVEEVGASDLAPALVLAHRLAAFAVLRASGTEEAQALREWIAHGGHDVALAIGRDTPLAADEREDGAVVLRGEAGPLIGTRPGDVLVLVATLGEDEWVHAAATHADYGGRLDVAADPLGLRRSRPARVTLDDVAVPRGRTAIDGAPVADPHELAGAVLAVLVAAAVAGAVRGSVDASAALMRGRAIPRPVPGVTSSTQDPLAQAVLGAALVPVEGAVALLLEVAAEIDGALAGAGVQQVDAAALRLRALAALEASIAAGLEQGEKVFEVVGTSGSGNAHGFDRLWRDIRTLSLEFPARPRRREIGTALIGVGS